MVLKDLMAAVELLKAIQDSNQAKESIESKSKSCDLAGKMVIVRCRDAGVHFGELVGHEGREVTLKNSRRMWYWKCKEGHTLSGCAVKGIHIDSKISAEVELVRLLEACEILLCSEEGAESISGAGIHNA